MTKKPRAGPGWMEVEMSGADLGRAITYVLPGAVWMAGVAALTVLAAAVWASGRPN